jgi:hypothetical protein
MCQREGIVDKKKPDSPPESGLSIAKNVCAGLLCCRAGVSGRHPALALCQFRCYISRVWRPHMKISSKNSTETSLTIVQTVALRPIANG